MSEKYVDSFVMAKKHGALEYVNCIADDVKSGKEISLSTSCEASR